MRFKSRKWTGTIFTIAFVEACITCSSAVYAGQAGRSFNVTVNLHASPGSTPAANQPNSAFCQTSDDPNAFGATYTVVCATGALVDIGPERNRQSFGAVHGGTYRYLFQANRGGNLLGTIDSDIAVGTIASWRIVNLSDRDYLEMLVNW